MQFQPPRTPEILVNRPQEIHNALVQLLNIQKENMASAYAKKIYDILLDFNNSIDPSQQVGIQAVNIGDALTMYISDVLYSNPSLIIFVGFLQNGQPVKIIQHITQISISMTTMPLMKPEEPKPLIGFRCAD